MRGEEPLREGGIYRTLAVAGRRFVIRYGYYTPADRESGALLPLLPDFRQNPLYAEDGAPFVTGIQDPCRHYRPRDGTAGDGWCGDCAHFPQPSAEIALCQCERNRKTGGESR